MRTYTSNVRFAKPEEHTSGWGTLCNANADHLDAMPPIRNFTCTLPDSEITSPTVRIRGGKFRWIEYSNPIESFGDAGAWTMQPYTVNYFYAVWESIRHWSSLPIDQSHIPIARVTTDAASAAVIEDLRCPYLMTGFSHLVAADYADDAAAGLAGVQIGELYHTSGTVKIRRT